MVTKLKICFHRISSTGAVWGIFGYIIFLANSTVFSQELSKFSFELLNRCSWCTCSCSQHGFLSWIYLGVFEYLFWGMFLYFFRNVRKSGKWGKIGLVEFIEKFGYLFFLIWFFNESVHYLLCSCTNSIFGKNLVWEEVLWTYQIEGFLSQLYSWNSLMFCMLQIQES